MTLYFTNAGETHGNQWEISHAVLDFVFFLKNGRPHCSCVPTVQPQPAGAEHSGPIRGRRPSRQVPTEAGAICRFRCAHGAVALVGGNTPLGVRFYYRLEKETAGAALREAAPRLPRRVTQRALVQGPLVRPCCATAFD